MTSLPESNTIVECAYDHMGRRCFKKVTTNGTVTLHQRYLYRGYLQIAAFDLTRSHHPALWFITWDPTQTIATRPLAIQLNGTWYPAPTRLASQGARSQVCSRLGVWLLKSQPAYGWDLTKNICELYGTTGYIATDYTYSPYGLPSQSTNGAAAGSIVQPTQWSSEYNDTELGLVYYNYRHYNPLEGRWLGRDIEFDEENRLIYGFVSNEAIINVDILGNAKKTQKIPTRARFDDKGINCIGYAANMNGNLQPHELSLQSLFKKLGWRCKKIKYHDTCDHDKNMVNQQVMIVYIHTVECTINGRSYTPEETYQWVQKHKIVHNAWSRSNFWGVHPYAHLFDYHGVKVENTSDMSKKYSCVERRSNTKLTIRYASSPDPWSPENVTIAKYCCKKGGKKCRKENE